MEDMLAMVVLLPVPHYYYHDYDHYYYYYYYYCYYYCYYYGTTATTTTTTTTTAATNYAFFNHFQRIFNGFLDDFYWILFFYVSFRLGE